MIVAGSECPTGFNLVWLGGMSVLPETLSGRRAMSHVNNECLTVLRILGSVLASDNNIEPITRSGASQASRPKRDYPNTVPAG